MLGETLRAERAEAANHARLSAATALRNPRVLGLSLVYFGINFGLVALVFFLPQILASFRQLYGADYGAVQLGLLTAVPYLVAIVVMIFWGWNSRRTGEVTWHIAVPMFLGGVSTASALYLSSPALAIAALAVTSACVFSAIPVFWQLPSTFLTGAAAASAIGLINTIGVSSNFVGPYLMGWLRDSTGGFQAGMLVIAVFMLAAGVLVVAMRGRAPTAAATGTEPSRAETGGAT